MNQENSSSGELPALEIVLAGPQNAGKSTLFNALCSANVETTNYPGATIERNIGHLRKDFGVVAEVSDTPGLATLTGGSPDQQITVKHLFAEERRDLRLIVVADATQLARHLFLVEQIRDSGLPIVVAITMVDDLEKRGGTIDTELLSKELSVPCIAVDARRKRGTDALIEAISKLSPATTVRKPVPPDMDTLLDAYERLDKLVARAVSGTAQESEPHEGAWLDRLVLHPVLGIIVFIGMMTLLFSAIFWAAAPVMDFIDGMTGTTVNWLLATLPDHWISDLFAEGVVGGIGSVIIFVPQIFILFGVMVVLQDSGYLARGAMLIDRPLRLIGLNGRSFVPLLSGFACAIPAMMAARTIQSRRERMLTLFIVPLMNCSARLPVYALLLTFLLPRDKPWLGGIALAGLYLLSIIMGTVVATIISRLPAFRAKHESAPFALELPPYRTPGIVVVFKSAWRRSWMFLKKAGPTIVVISCGLWLLTHLPVQSAQSEDEYVAISESYAAKIGHVIEPVFRPMGLDWRGAVCMITGFAAREVFASSMVLMYRADVADDADDDAVEAGLLSTMRDVTFEGTDKKIFTPSTCMGLLFFFAMALQCFPTVVTARDEFGGWPMALAQLVGYTGGAWLGAVIIVNSLRALGVS